MLKSHKYSAIVTKISRSILFLTQEDKVIIALKDNPDNEWPLWRLVLTGLNIIALVLSVVLSWHYLKGGAMPGCDGTSACEQVLGSRWSAIAGKVPVSGLAMGAYLAMLIAVFHTGPSTEASLRRLAWAVLLILTGSITGMAIWFTIVQKWLIGEFCPYCLTAHVSGVLMAVIIIWQARKSNPSLPVIKLMFGGLILAGMLVASQAVFTPKAGYREGRSQDNLPAIAYHDAPMVGSPDAPYVIKMLFDYACPHCQKIHLLLNDAVSRYNGKLAFALCPTPLNTECNPYIPHNADAFRNSCELARIGLTVWIAQREAFPAFDKWMFSLKPGNTWHPRSPEAARVKAIELVGKAKFNAAQSSPWVTQYIQTCVQTYGQTVQNGNGGVPKLIFGSRWVIPDAANAADLVNILQKSLSVPKP